MGLSVALINYLTEHIWSLYYVLASLFYGKIAEVSEFVCKGQIQRIKRKYLIPKLS